MARRRQDVLEVEEGVREYYECGPRDKIQDSEFCDSGSSPDARAKEFKMGFLTTFTIYNDGIGEIEKRPKEFANAVCRGVSSGASGRVSIGGFSNVLKIQRSRHSSDNAVYAHAGNTVTEMKAYSRDAEEMCRKNPNAFDELLRVLESEVRELKKMKKEIECKVSEAD